MPSNPTNSLRLEKQGQGEHLNTWGTGGGLGLNNALDMIDAAIAGQSVITVTGSFTLTSSNYTADQARNAVLVLIGAPAAPFTVTTPGVTKVYLVRNATGQPATVTTGAGATVTIPAGLRWLIACDGTNWDGAVVPLTLDQNGAAVSSVNFGGQRGINAADPQSPQDICTRAYADALAFTANAGILPGQVGNDGSLLYTTANVAKWLNPGAPGQVLASAGPGATPVYANLGLPRAAAGGTADAITATYTPAVGLTDQTIVALVASAPNITTAPTFSPNGLPAHTVTKRGGRALLPGDIPGAGAVIVLEYSAANTRWELLNPGSVPTSYVQISQTVVGSPVATVDLTNINQEDVIIDINGLQQNSGSSVNLNLYFTTNNGSSWTLWGALASPLASGVSGYATLFISGMRSGFAVLSGTNLGPGMTPPALAATRAIGGQIGPSAQVNGLRIAPASGNLSAGTITLLGR